MNQSYETKSVVTGHGATLDYSAVVANYKAVNVPALKEEGNIYCISQFFSTVSYELRSIQIPGQIPKNFASQWTDVDKQLFDSDIFTEINAGCKFKKEVDPIKDSDKSFTDKVIAIRNLVADKVKWDKSVRLIPRSASTVLKEASGSNADINALVGNALKYAGFTVTPVVIKLRSNGELYDDHVSTDAFDTFILKVASEKGDVLMLDAASPNGYANIFPVMFLVPKARQISKDKSSRPWLDITGLTKNETSYDAAAKLDSEGLLTATIKVSSSGEESMYLKEYYNSFDKKEDFYSKWENNNSYTVVDLSTENMNTYSPDCSMTIEAEKQMQTTEDRIYLKPIIETIHSESRFKSETRRVPVDFPYRETTTYHIKVELPDGYEVEQMPSNVTCGPLKSDSKTVIEYKLSGDGRALEVFYTYVMNDMYVDPHDYSDFRRYWLQIIKAENETVVLKKK